MASNNHCMISNHFPMLLAFRTIFRMMPRMTLRMTFITWDFRLLSKEDFEGNLMGTSRDLEGDLEGDLEVDLEVDLEGDLDRKLGGGLQRGLQRGLQTGQGLEGDLFSSSG